MLSCDSAASLYLGVFIAENYTRKQFSRMFGLGTVHVCWVSHKSWTPLAPPSPPPLPPHPTPLCIPPPSPVPHNVDKIKNGDRIDMGMNNTKN